MSSLHCLLFVQIQETFVSDPFKDKRGRKGAVAQDQAKQEGSSVARRKKSGTQWVLHRQIKTLSYTKCVWVLRIRDSRITNTTTTCRTSCGTYTRIFVCVQVGSEK